MAANNCDERLVSLVRTSPTATIHLVTSNGATGMVARQKPGTRRFSGAEFAPNRFPPAHERYALPPPGQRGPAIRRSLVAVDSALAERRRPAKPCRQRSGSHERFCRAIPAGLGGRLTPHCSTLATASVIVAPSLISLRPCLPLSHALLIGAFQRQLSSSVHKKEHATPRRQSLAPTL
jgi:hypothetical protein